MLRNIKSVSNIKTYKCNRLVSDWLQKEQKIPLLSYEGEFFYFVDNDQLRMALDRLPFWLLIYK